MSDDIEVTLQRMLDNVQARIDYALDLIKRQEAGLVELREEHEKCTLQLKEHADKKKNTAYERAIKYPIIIACGWPVDPCVCGEHDVMQHRERDSQ